jgi:ABC-2 type transport system ATP-binding protein
MGTISIAEPIEAKRRLAFMPDEPHCSSTSRSRASPPGRTALSVEDFERRSRALLGELELTGKEDSLPAELSRGMRQKVVIACGLVRSATTLLFDEPLTGLDPLGIRRMRETIASRPARARRSCCRRICCTWSKRCARAS